MPEIGYVGEIVRDGKKVKVDVGNMTVAERFNWIIDMKDKPEEWAYWKTKIIDMRDKLKELKT